MTSVSSVVDSEMSKLNWSDADEIGYQLYQEFRNVDPLHVRFTELRQRVLGLAEFGGDPAASSEGALEAIQMAWLEYFREG